MNPTLSHFFTRRRGFVAAGAFALAGVLAAVHGAQANANPAIALKRDAQPVTRGQLERASFSDVVKRVSPSVVKITTETKAKRIATGGSQFGNQFPGADDPMFRRFFGGRMPELRQEPMSGLGSGVIISSDGYIATNNHVVDGADTLTVALADGRELTAKVVGRDPQTDIAVIKVDAKDLPAITLADSSKIEVGDRVLAIGNPFGIGETVTSGIVSAKDRRVGILEDVQGYENFIQTDAAINPGNSGGALVDVDGRLIGINTAILSHSGGFQGVGLAVPANIVSQVTDSLVKNGKVVRGYLGVNIQSITPALEDSFHLKSRDGALVAEVMPDSPAAKAGLKEGDVITAINGQPVTDANNLTLSVTGLAPGAKLDLSVLRDGHSKELTATAGERPNSRRGRSEETYSNNDNRDEGVLNGVAVDDLDRDARQQFDVPARLKGAVITNVEPDSAAARAGLRPGDVILEINKQPVKNAQQAVDLTAKTENKKTLLKLWSRGSTIFVVVDESGSDKAAS
ncbi:MAG TPA: DegQ family serine endoprotease [Vicinamibacterales bacterium]|nr:DegQ family serine endoprotease [Opitutaceae bacterium]HVZ22374.1 DegQ family serine endoprotease [Vicinamibacterales bacterium]